MNTYDAFAYFYDQYKEGDDYESFMSQYIKIAENDGFIGKKIIDLGCGTGTSMLPLLKRNYDVVGIDNSNEMLNAAALKLKAFAPLLQNQSIVDFQLINTFDLAIAVDDVMNHLLSEKDLSKCFSSVHQCLIDGGLFIFDVNTSFTFEQFFNSTHVYEEKGHTYIWKATYKNGYGQADITRFQKKKGQFEKQCCQVNECYYSKNILTKLLEENYFELIRIYGYADQTFNKTPNENNDLKHLYVARKR